MIKGIVCHDQPDLMLVCLWQAPGVLHHIMIRGIERRTIFRDNKDRENFLDRLASLLPETKTPRYAWTLIPNHIFWFQTMEIDIQSPNRCN